MSADKVAELVAAALKKFADPGLGTELHVLVSEIRLRDGWWYVPVYPERELDNMYDMYDVLANAAEELDESGVDIQLVPAMSAEPIGKIFEGKA